MAQSLLDSVRLPYVLADPRHASLTSAQVYALRNRDPQWAGMTQDWLDAIERDVASLAARPLGQVRALAQERSRPLCFGHVTPREAAA